MVIHSLLFSGNDTQIKTARFFGSGGNNILYKKFNNC